MGKATKEARKKFEKLYEELKAAEEAIKQTAAEAMNVLWAGTPASKTASGTAGQIAKDDNFIYVCTATDTWKRSPIATNW